MRVTRAAARAALVKKKIKEETFRILDLPPELVEQAFGHLTEESPCTLPNIRLVCRAFSNHCLIAFGATFFNHIIAILHPLSLTILLEIASHSHLSRFVRQVTISGERLGGVIDMSGQRNARQLQDLQSSMEQSGMDRLILTDVFRKLPELLVVGIDNQTFRGDTESADAARCGSRYLFNESTKYDLDSPQRGITRAFDAVFNSLHHAGVADEIFIHMGADILTPESQNNRLLNINSFLWRWKFAPSVMILQLSGELYSRWTLDLLRSVRNLQQLEIFIADGLFQLSHPDTGLFEWPELYRLKLDDVNCHAEGIVAFFKAHKDTLMELYLQGVDFISGSYIQPLEIMRSMPQLTYMFLSVPHETTLPSSPATSFDRYSDFSGWEVHSFRLYSNCEIRNAITAILEDFRTTNYKCYIGYLDTMLYRVDLRRAHAVVSGKAGTLDGECNSLVEEET